MWPTAVLASALVRPALVLTTEVPGAYGGGGGGDGGEGGEAEGGDDGAGVFALGVGVEVEEGEEEKLSGGEAEAGAEGGDRVGA